MTKQDFEALAKILEDYSGSEDLGLTTQDVVAEIAERIADHCRKRNPRFSRSRFLSAAGHYSP